MRNRTLDKLAAGEEAVGMALVLAAPGMIEFLGRDWDFFWIDMQHGLWDYAGLLEVARACDLRRTDAMVRVPGHEPGTISRVLDAAVGGVIVPMVESAAEARAVVEAAKFPPLGKRSYGGRRLVDMYTRDYVWDANERSMVFCQIETPEGVVAAEEIAAVDGVGALFFGPDDYRLRLGGPMDLPFDDPRLTEAATRTVRAAEQAGKPCLIIAPTPEQLRFARGLGARILVLGSDKTLLQKAADQALAMARSPESMPETGS